MTAVTTVTMARRILIVEDGHEYTEAFRRLTPRGAEPALEFVRAETLGEARELLSEVHPEALFLDVVFDRVPEEKLTGDLEALIHRFGGDRARAVRHLMENQGFYLLDALAPHLGVAMPVVLAYDFTAEPQRLEALRRRVPRLSGLPDGASISQALERLLG